MDLIKQSEGKRYGVIFDVDGTLLDSMPIWDKAASRYLEKLGIQAESNLGKILFPMTMAEGAEYIIATYHINQTINQIIEGVNQIVTDFYLHEVKEKKGILTLLTKLKEKRIPITIATSSDRPLIEGALKRLQILPYIDAIYTCSEVGIGKDKPDIYYKASQSMNTMPSNTYVFEDAFHAIMTAKDAGFITVGVYDEMSDDSKDKIKSICDYYIYNYEVVNFI